MAFRHPHAGNQLVKGGVEPGERVIDAARRELFEESGLRGRRARWVGRLVLPNGMIWEMVDVDVASAPHHWAYDTQDGGGLRFEFFWMPLRARVGQIWTYPFRSALNWIRTY